MLKKRPFLTAEWRYLLMLNYEVEPSLLLPLVPTGTELDLWQGQALVSMVGFRFLNTRVLGLGIPFHRSFSEVNLRFYVLRRTSDGKQKRGVCFIKEIVPLPAIANTARMLYGENYISLPMKHTIESGPDGLNQDGLVEYAWRYRGKLNRMGGLAVGKPRELEAGSEEEFITEHYWGYTHLGDHRTGEYEVIHPAWRLWEVAQPYLLCDITALYGQVFERFLHRRPRSAFLAEGSAVSVMPGEVIKTVKQKSPAKKNEKKSGRGKTHDQPA